MTVHNEFDQPLSPRQVEYVAMCPEGLTIEEIAAVFFVSPHTVKNTLDDARSRAHARNITQLVALCVAAGYVSWEDDPPILSKGFSPR